MSELKMSPSCCYLLCIGQFCRDRWRYWQNSWLDSRTHQEPNEKMVGVIFEFLQKSQLTNLGNCVTGMLYKSH